MATKNHRVRGLAGRLALLALVVGLLVAATWRPLPEQQSTFRSGAGYTSKVNGIFVSLNLLQVDSDSETGEVKISLSPEIAEDPVFQQYRMRSRLSADMVNSGNSMWRMYNDRVVGMEPNAHDVQLPSWDPPRWRGDLEFRTTGEPKARIVLTSPAYRIELEPTDFNAPGRDPSQRCLDVEAEPGPNGPREVKTSFVRLCTRGPGNRDVAIADLNLLGDMPVVSVPGDSPYSVSVDGRPVPKPQRAALPHGSQIEIRLKGVRGPANLTLQATEHVEQAAMISSPRLGLENQLDMAQTPSGDNVRKGGPWPSDRWRAPGYEPFAVRAEQAMRRIVATAANEKDWENRELRLTLERDVDARLRTLVEAFAKENADAWGDYTVAVTLMDAKTGDILGMASAETRDGAGQLQRGSQSPEEPNFRRLQIGSAAKPLIAAAILESYPNFGSLVITPADFSSIPGPQGKPIHPIPDVLGVKLTDNNLGLKTPARNDTPCNFDCFIQWSDNKYAAALMLLAAPRRAESWVSSGETFWFDGQTQQRRRLSVFEKIEGGKPVFDTSTISVPLDWDSNLRTLYDLDYEGRRPGTPEQEAGNCHPDERIWGDYQYDMRIWRHVYDAEGAKDTCAFGAISPAREHFVMDQLTDFQTEMLLTMIGGGEARWSNVKLAEAYARIVTGKRIEANLVMPQSPSDAYAYLPLPLKADVREQVTHALTLVRLGTAQHDALNGPILDTRDMLEPYGLKLGFFSKTGTPAIDIPQYDSTSRAINVLIGSGFVALDRDGMLVLRLTKGVEHTPSKETNAAAVADLRNDADALDLIEKEGASIPRVVTRLSDINVLIPEERRKRLRVIGQSMLASLAGPANVRTVFGKSYVFVAGSYAAGLPVDGNNLVTSLRPSLGAALADPEAAYVVAINIQNEVDDPNLAVKFAGTIFGSVISPMLLAEAQTNAAAQATRQTPASGQVKP